MKRWLLAISMATVGCGTLAVAAPATPVFVTSTRVIEATSGSIVLPSGPGSTLVVTPCRGCPPKSIAATATTTYYLNKQEVSLARLSAALAGKTDVYVSLFQSTQTGELTRVVAALNESTTTHPANPK